MELIVTAAFFILGAIIASFVGVVSGRLHTGESILAGRSRCDACNLPLSPSALIPVVSYLASEGRARCCGASISLLAPLSELLLGGLFVVSYMNVGIVAPLPLLLVSLSALLALVLYDLTHQILPPSLLVIFVVMGALTGFFLSPSTSDFIHTTLIAVAIGSSLALIHFLSRGRAMGLSDAPLAFGLSLLAGPAALPGFVFSFWIGALFGIGVLLKRPAGSRMGIEVPFAPYLAAGFLLAYFTQWNLFTLITG